MIAQMLVHMLVFCLCSACALLVRRRSIIHHCFYKNPLYLPFTTTT
jgi:hypothetical protein